MRRLALPCPFAMGDEMVGETAELGEGLDIDATGKPADGAGLVPRSALIP